MKTLVKCHPVRGRGLFARSFIAAGEIIEICELILIDTEDAPDTLEAYVYHYRRGTVALALGNGSLLNHSDRSNSGVAFNYQKRQLVIRAKKAISPEEEITIDYGYDQEQRRRFKIST